MTGETLTIKEAHILNETRCYNIDVAAPSGCRCPHWDYEDVYPHLNDKEVHSIRRSRCRT